MFLVNVVPGIINVHSVSWIQNYGVDPQEHHTPQYIETKLN
jgi:hypothetical protein